MAAPFMDVGTIGIVGIKPEAGLGSRQHKPQPAEDFGEQDRDDAAETDAPDAAAGKGASPPDTRIDRSLPSPPPGMGMHVDIVV